MSEVITGQFGGDPYKDLDAMTRAILAAIYEHSDRVPLLGAIGALEEAKRQLFARAIDG